ncbi:ribonuclease P [Candidatus Woesearchaeota archaeon]|nr:ribonuclease P [Candidatus Woesearchaeota archaeon]
MKKRSSELQTKVCLQIYHLFAQAQLNSKLADKYVKLARKLAMKFNLPLPRELKRKFCNHCYTYFQDGNYRVRTRDKNVVYYCLTCKKYMRFPKKLPPSK